MLVEQANASCTPATCSIRDHRHHRNATSNDKSRLAKPPVVMAVTLDLTWHRFAFRVGRSPSGGMRKGTEGTFEDGKNTRKREKWKERCGSPGEPGRAVVLAGLRRWRRREKVCERRPRFWRFRRWRRYVVVGGGGGGSGVQIASIYFGVCAPLHFTLVRPHVSDRHRDPIVDPRKSLTVSEQQYFADRLQKRQKHLFFVFYHLKSPVSGRNESWKHLTYNCRRSQMSDWKFGPAYFHRVPFIKTEIS